MLNLASKFGKVEGYIFLSMCAKFRSRLQELLQKRPIIPPQQINVSSCQTRFFPKRSLGGEELGGVRRGYLGLAAAAPPNAAMAF